MTRTLQNTGSKLSKQVSASPVHKSTFHHNQMSKSYKSKPRLKILLSNYTLHAEQACIVAQYAASIMEDNNGNHSEHLTWQFSVGLCIVIISIVTHPHTVDGREARRIQIWSGQGCRVPVEPIPPHAGTPRTQRLGLMEENYSPTPPRLRPFHAPPASHLQWSLLGLSEAKRL